MGLTASQIRQDLNCFGGFGQQGYGYVVEQLYAEIGRILGLDVLTPAILLGAGNLGRAVANHMDFEQKGFRLVAIFDDSPSIIGQKIRGMEVLPTKLIEETCRRQNVKSRCSVSKEAAASIVEYLISLDIRGFGISAI